MPEQVQGVLQTLNKGGGFLRNPDMSFQSTPQDPWVSSKLIREYGLEDGAFIVGTAEANKKGLQLLDAASVCGLEPAQFQNRTRFEQLLAISPTERMRLAQSGNVSMRVVELVAPIGKGTRGMIVAPPKTGKTLLLEQIANAIHAHEPDTRIVVLLIDERPEEVTHFRRSVQAEVLASSSDQNIASHTNLAELTMAHVRCDLECGRDVVVLLDSITRLGRAFNLHGAGARRTMSGGLDAKALEIPRRFFGLARNIENGGSVTVIATALVETSVGYVLGASFGFLLALLMGQFRVVRMLVVPAMIVSQAVPIVAIAAPLVIIFGFGIVPKLIIVAWIVFFPVVVSVLDGLSAIDRDALNLARLMGGGGLRTFLIVKLPACVGPLFSGLKIGATYAVTGAVIGEWTASSERGLGTYLLAANAQMDTAGVYAAVLLLTAVGVGSFLLVLGIEILATPWRHRAIAPRWAR